jgi:hypothetical protein
MMTKVNRSSKPTQAHDIQLVLLMNFSEINGVLILSKLRHIYKCLSLYRLISHHHLVSRLELPEVIFSLPNKVSSNFKVFFFVLTKISTTNII